MTWAAKTKSRFRGAVRRVDDFSKKHPLLAAGILGVFMPLGFAPFFFLPIYYLALAGFCVLWARALGDVRRQGFLGFCFGFTQYFVGLIWVGEAFLVEAEQFLGALPFAVTLLPFWLSLATAGAAAVAGFLVRARVAKLPALLVLLLCLSLADLFRTHALSGFPWNHAEQAWAGFLPLAQSVAVFGPLGTGLWVLGSGVLLALGTRRAVIVAVAIPLIFAAFGAARLKNLPPREGVLRILLVQPNINQRDKWRPELRQKHIDNIFQLTASGLRAMPDKNLPNKKILIVWPEVALPILLDEGPGFADLLRTRLPKTKYARLLSGAVRRQQNADGTYSHFNGAQIWTLDGRLQAHSDKHHLVPFGEYMPFQAWLEAIGMQQLARLRGGYAAGDPHARLEVEGLPLIAPLICYEVIFAWAAAGPPRPDMLANLTNDGWFGASLGPHQHFAQSRLRAIEQGLPLVRAANTGISAVLDAQGRVLGKIGLQQRGFHIAHLPPPAAPTLYARFGRWIYALQLGVLGVIILFTYFRQKTFAKN